jgi:hypothetical protein
MAQKDLTFAQALKLFSEATANSMKYAQICAMMAIRHFADHGNLVYCQQFMDAMPKNYIRQVAFQKWLVAHAPVTMEKGKFLKDTSENAAELDLEGAEKEHFWDFAPDKEVLSFGPDDVMDALKAIVKKFENPKRFKAKDDLASAAVVSLKNYVATKAPKTTGNLPEQGIEPTVGEQIGDLPEDGGSDQVEDERPSVNSAGDNVISEATA